MDFAELVGDLRQRFSAADLTLPLNRRLRQAIEDAIGAHVLKRGALLPGERQLAEGLELSRVTVRRTIEDLVADGTLRRRHGARTEVSTPVEKSLSTLTSFSEDMILRGVKPGAIWLSRELTRPSPAEMLALGIPTTENVVRFRRVRTGDAAPIAVETSTVPVRFLPDPEAVTDSLYEALAARDCLPERALQRMRSRPASAQDAELLRCNPGAPLLVVDRRCFLADGQIVEYSESRYAGEAYDFVIELKR